MSTRGPECQHGWASVSAESCVTNSRLYPPDSLLGRLQRGRGDAVRELLAMPVAQAGPVLVQCLCTQDGPSRGFSQHCEAYVELILTLSPDLTEWFRWVMELGPDSSEDTVDYAVQLLAEAAVRGHSESMAFLRGYVVRGHHWNSALSAILGHELVLDVDTWAQLVPRLDDDALARHMGAGGALWDELARREERVARLLRDALQRQAEYGARTSWSAANYADAELSQQRWRVLKDLIDRDPASAAALVADGLWDGSWMYRNRCIELCDLDLPRVRERVLYLASMAQSHSAEVARRRLRNSKGMH